MKGSLHAYASGKFKPMLAAVCRDITKLKYPLMASPKLDGVRAIVIDGRLMSRSLLPIPNRYVQDLSSSLPSGADGELILGKANDDPYRRTVSAVMSDDSSSGLTVNFHVFDNYL